MSSAFAPAARLPPAVWLLGWAAAVGLAIVAAAIGPFVPRSAFAAACCVAASLWAWRVSPAGSPRLWLASVPIAAWVTGTFGWDGAAAASVAALVLLLRTDRPAGRKRSAPGFAAELPATPEPEPLAADEEEDEPDQWFTRTATGSADVVSGELLIDCDAAGGTGHVLFWPAFAGPPRVSCHPADGLGRVRAVLRAAARGAIGGRPDANDPGPVRVVYEATGPVR